MTIGTRSPVALAAVALLVAGCEEPPAPKAPLEATAASLSVEGLSVAPAGPLDGKRFEAKSAHYRVTRYPGRHRIDLYFDDPEPESCGLPLPRSGRRVFLRFPELQRFEVGEWSVEVDADEPPLEVHYEVGDTREWYGRAGGVAVLAIDEVEDRAVAGRLNVCFDDGQQSCVKGAFRAEECITRVDGQAVREGIGLLEPVPEGE